jgi:uncharacterized membrane protein
MAGIGEERSVEEVLSEGYSLDIGKAFSTGWETFKAGAGLFIAWTVLTWVVIGVCGLLKTPGALVAGYVVMPFAIAGFLSGAFTLMKTGTVQFDDFTKVFQRFGEIIVVGILIALIASIGFMLCILPGIYVKIAMFFAMPLVVARGVPAVDAIKASFNVANKNLVEVLLVALACFGILIAGALLCGIGLLVATPLVYCIMAAAYVQVFGLAGEAPVQAPETTPGQ